MHQPTQEEVYLSIYLSITLIALLSSCFDVEKTLLTFDESSTTVLTTTVDESSTTEVDSEDPVVIDPDSVTLPEDIIRDIFRPMDGQFTFETTATLEISLEVLDHNENGVQTIVDISDADGNLLYRGATDGDGVLTDEITVALAEGRTTLVLWVNGTETRTIIVENFGDILKLDRTLYTPVPVTEETDTDGDGIINTLDQFPEDPDRAFLVRFPANERYTICFEDLYPTLGDADYNDFLASYKLIEIRNAQNEVVVIEGEVEARARVAGYNHDFHLRILDLPDATGTITYMDHLKQVQSTVPIESDGTVLDLLIFESTKDSFDQRTSAMENGDMDEPYEPGYYTQFELVLNPPRPSGMIAPPPYDPYIHVRNTGKNVHLPGKGLGEPDSPTYLDEEGYPWALLVPVTWYYPLETVDIREAYSDYSTWVVSNGIDAADWYRKPVLDLTYHRAMMDGTIEAITLDVERIDAVTEGGAVITVFDQLLELDMLTYFTGEPLSFGFAEIPPGVYTNIRFVVGDGNTITVDGMDYPLEVASPSEVGLVLEPVGGAWQLEEGDEVSFDVDFSAADQVTVLADASYVLKPSLWSVVSVRSSDECCYSAVVDYITYADGGTIKMGDRLELEFPPGAVTEDVLIRVCPVETPEPTAEYSFFGDWYEFIPAGLTFTQEVNVSMCFNSDEVIEGGIVDPIQNLSPQLMSITDNASEIYVARSIIINNTICLNSALSHFTIVGPFGQASIGEEYDDRVPLYLDSDFNERDWHPEKCQGSVETSIFYDDECKLQTAARYVVEFNGNCSGFLVGPNIVLTAGHCLHRVQTLPGGFVEDISLIEIGKSKICLYQDDNPYNKIRYNPALPLNSDGLYDGDCYKIISHPNSSFFHAINGADIYGLDYAFLWVENSIENMNGSASENGPVRYETDSNIAPGCPIDTVSSKSCLSATNYYDHRIADISFNRNEMSYGVNVIGYPVFPPYSYDNVFNIPGEGAMQFMKSNVTTLSHPLGCGYLGYNPHQGHYDMHYPDSFFQFNCDILAESSGSPIYDSMWYTVGLVKGTSYDRNNGHWLSKIAEESDIWITEIPLPYDRESHRIGYETEGNILIAFFPESTNPKLADNDYSIELKLRDISINQVNQDDSNHSNIERAVVKSTQDIRSSQNQMIISNIPDGEYFVKSRFHRFLKDHPLEISPRNSWIVGPWQLENQKNIVKERVFYSTPIINNIQPSNITDATPGNNYQVEVELLSPNTKVWKSGEIFVYYRVGFNIYTKKIFYSSPNELVTISLQAPENYGYTMQYLISARYLADFYDETLWSDLSDYSIVSISTAVQP